MNRREKESVVRELREDFAKSAAAFLIDVEGMSVKDSQALRRGLHQSGGNMRIAKNTLLRIATDDLKAFRDLRPFFTKQIAVIFAEGDSQEVVRVIYDASRNNSYVSIVAGYFDGMVVEKERIEFFAKLPSKEQILAQLCGGLKTPIILCISLFNQVIASFLLVMKSASQRKVE